MKLKSPLLALPLTIGDPRYLPKFLVKGILDIPWKLMLFHHRDPSRGKAFRLYNYNVNLQTSYHTEILKDVLNKSHLITFSFNK